MGVVRAERWGRPYRWFVTVNAALLASVVLAVAALVGVGSGAGLTVVGLGLLAVAALMQGYDAWTSRRPAPVVEGGTTCVEASRLLSWTALVGMVGLGLAVVDLLVREGSAIVRDEPFLLLSVPVAAVAVLWSLVTLLRPDRLEVGLQGVVVRRSARTRRVPWADLEAVEVGGGMADALRLRRRGGRPVLLPTRMFALGGAALRDLVESARPGPRDR